MEQQPSVERADVEQARARIAGAIRRTPVLQVRSADLPGGEVWLKLECLQVSGSFKARGALNAALALPPEARARGLVTASGGDHGLGVAFAAREVGTQARVYLPTTTPESKRLRLEEAGAEVIVAGAVWDEANALALEDAGESGRAYVHAFAAPAVIAGQGTVALEILEQVPDVANVLIGVGGGGLISGCALAIGAAARVIGVEPVGAPTLSASLAAGELVTLEAIETAATSLAPRRSEALNLALVERLVDRVVLVSDDELRSALGWLKRETGMRVELSAVAGLAALLQGRVTPSVEGPTCVVICGRA